VRTLALLILARAFIGWEKLFALIADKLIAAAHARNR
jgi:hypothetical protein